MATFRKDVTLNETGPHASGESSLAKNEARVVCPLCGSPHVAAFADGEQKYSDMITVEIRDVRVCPWLADPKKSHKQGKIVDIKQAIPGFHCAAGDCGYTGAVGRS